MLCGAAPEFVRHTALPACSLRSHFLRSGGEAMTSRMIVVPEALPTFALQLFRPSPLLRTRPHPLSELHRIPRCHRWGSYRLGPIKCSITLRHTCGIRGGGRLSEHEGGHVRSEVSDAAPAAPGGPGSRGDPRRPRRRSPWRRRRDRASKLRPRWRQRPANRTGGHI